MAHIPFLSLGALHSRGALLHDYHPEGQLSQSEANLRIKAPGSPAEVCGASKSELISQNVLPVFT